MKRGGVVVPRCGLGEGCRWQGSSSAIPCTWGVQGAAEWGRTARCSGYSWILEHPGWALSSAMGTHIFQLCSSRLCHGVSIPAGKMAAGRKILPSLPNPISISKASPAVLVFGGGQKCLRAKGGTTGCSCGWPSGGGDSQVPARLCRQ